MNEFIFKGIFFVLPCIESYERVDLRTITLGVPPQEVGMGTRRYMISTDLSAGVDQGQCDRVSGCCGLLQGQ